MNYRIRLFYILFIALGFTPILNAQYHTLYFMDVPTQNNMMNPALQPKRSTLQLSLSLFFYLDNSTFTVNDLFTEKNVNNNEVVYWDFENIDAKLRDQNYVHLGTGSTPLYFGAKIGEKWYVNFSTSLEYHSTFSFPGTISAIRFGNADIETELPRTIDLNNYSLNEISYTEYAFGGSVKITDRLLIGAHIKAMMGLSAIKTNNFNASIETSDNFESSTLKTDVDMDVSGVIFETSKEEQIFKTKGALDEFLIGKNASSFNNFGLGIDIGCQYFLTKNWDVQASVTDIGSIKWGLEPQKIISKGEYTFDGFQFSPYQLSDDDFDFSEYLKQYSDTITSTFIPETVNESFKTELPTQLFIGSNFTFLNNFEAHVLYRQYLQTNNNLKRAALGISYHANKYLSVSGSLSYSNFWFYNVGLGVRVNTKHLQFYLVTDNINVIDTRNVKGINAAFGISVRLWRGKPDYKQYWKEPVATSL